MNWRFVTKWVTNQGIQSRAVTICARDELTAYTGYCQLGWVQNIDYAQFDSLTITLLPNIDTSGK